MRMPSSGVRSVVRDMSCAWFSGILMLYIIGSKTQPYALDLVHYVLRQLKKIMLIQKAIPKWAALRYMLWYSKSSQCPLFIDIFNKKIIAIHYKVNRSTVTLWKHLGSVELGEGVLQRSCAAWCPTVALSVQILVTADEDSLLYEGLFLSLIPLFINL